MILRTFAVSSLLTLSSAGAFGATLVVNALSDIYSAGHSSLPNTTYPGAFAPSASFISADNQFLSFSSVTGLVGCNFVITNGADGGCYPGVDTTVTSYAGLSGITVRGDNLFLVGVFLSSAEPAGSGPPVLVYNDTAQPSLTTSDASFSPELNQVFFVGDGLTGTGTGQRQQFRVPRSASLLYLGFADSFDGAPSYYDDNVGSLTATFQFQEEVPEPGTWLTFAAGTLLLLLLRSLRLHFQKLFHTRKA